MIDGLRAGARALPRSADDTSLECQSRLATLRRAMWTRPLAAILSMTSLLAACGGGAPASREAVAQAATRRDDGPTARIVARELDSLLEQPHVESARVVVLSVDDGSVLAATGRDRSGLRPSLATDEVRSHGSTAKTFTIAAALDAGAVQAGDTFEGGTITRGGETIVDHETHGTMTLSDVMSFSSNVGTTRIFDRLGAARLASTLRGFGLSVPADLGTDPLRDTRLAYGAALEATSLEVASGYLVLARGGLDREGRRVISPAAAAHTLSLLEDAVSRSDATGHPASIEGLRVAGKTGTMRLEGSRTFGVFVGIVPVERPTHVILVGVEARGQQYGGGAIAAPAFARLAPQLLR